MSSRHGGFFIQRDDIAVGSVVHGVIGDYLDDTGQARELNVMWCGRAGLSALLVLLGPGAQPDETSSRWVTQNLGLGGRLARATGRVWAYTYDSDLGNETVAEFAPDGTITDQRETGWGDGAKRALDRLCATLEIPRPLVEYDLAFAARPHVQRIDATFDDAAFAEWIAARAPIVRPQYGELAVLYLQEDAAAELARTAEALGVRSGDVIVAMWEGCKPDIFATIPLVERDHLQGPEAFLKPPPSRETPIQLAEAQRAPALDPNSPKVAVRLYLDADTIREMQELALAGDRSQSYVLQKTYARGRERLLATVPDGG